VTDEPRFEPAPNRDEVPERRQLGRSTQDRWIAGVASGLAAYFDVPPFAVRLGLVVLALWITPPPILLAYVVAAFALPRRETLPVSVDWQPNSMRVTWRGSVAPYAVSWSRLFGIFAGVCAATILLSGVLGIVMGPGGFELAAIAHAPVVPLALLGLLYAIAPRTWALTLSESALWVEAPGRRPRRIELTAIEGFHPTSHPFTIHLRDGTLETLAPPPDGPELDVVVDELRRSVARVSDHEASLKATEDERERLVRVAGAAKAREGSA